MGEGDIELPERARRGLDELGEMRAAIRRCARSR